MATAAKRVVVSELQKKVATLKVGENTFTFNYEAKVGENVTVVNISGAIGNGHLNYSVNGSIININFNNTPYNEDVIRAINLEIEDITKPVIVD
ncbi:hypothetical protein [Pedobacter nyackensis]|uniref:Uncharacterized protein n=1 Tax=Pedobacter nyackensis TaxID=475255 RepID=A0A1W1ZZ25_9SPHI|nr:hypothetical protein [Pedobacter nyackensis]SMC53411.1 hypothetical protein SAMN04488101_101155 [Pedobacter nyackensis]